MALFPAAEEFESALDDARAKNWDRLLAVREEVLKALEPARAAKTDHFGPRSARDSGGGSELAHLLEKYASNLPALFIVSQVEIANRNGQNPAHK